MLESVSFDVLSISFVERERGRVVAKEQGKSYVRWNGCHIKKFFWRVLYLCITAYQFIRRTYSEETCLGTCGFQFLESLIGIEGSWENGF